MRVQKRDGSMQEVHLSKIEARIAALCDTHPALTRIDPILISQKVVQGLYNSVTTAELDQLAIETCAGISTKDPQYNVLAARIAVSNLHKQTHDKFSAAMTELYNFKHFQTGASGLLEQSLYETVMENAEVLDAAVQSKRDYDYTLFGFKTLERSYLLKCDKRIVERPGYMIMRVALGIHGTDIESAIRTYESMSTRLYTHATPTLFNSGTKRPQMSSCFLLNMEDSIEGIYKTLTDCAQISKNSGGIGIHAHHIRANGSYIAGTGGTSNGIIPMLRVFNDSSRYVDQGGGKRPGRLVLLCCNARCTTIVLNFMFDCPCISYSIAVYLEPHHPDIMAFLDLRKNNGNEADRCRDLFTAMWISDLFMERVKNKQQWSLLCP